MTYEEIREQAAHAVTELLAVAKLNKGDIFVIGCSSSEIKGRISEKGPISMPPRPSMRA